MSIDIYEKNKYHLVRYVSWALVALSFTAIFLYFYHPIKTGDFWWHLNTGRWIWENSTLPVDDPFTYTSTQENADRIELIVQGYWLSQLLYYISYLLGGLNGVAILNALTFTLIMYIIWWIHRDNGLHPFWSLLIISPCAVVMIFYDEVRPHAFTFLGVSVLYLLLNKARKVFRESQSINWATVRYFVLIPAVALIWANMHRGFMVIYAVLAAYAFGELFVLNSKAKGSIAKLAIFIALATLINPNLFDPIIFGLNEIIFGWGTHNNIVELYSPFKYAAINGTALYIWLVGAIAFTGLIAMMINYRSLEPSDVLLFLGFGYLGSSIFRLTAFFIILSTIISGRYLARFSNKSSGKSNFVAGALVLLVVMAGLIYDRNVDKHTKWYYDVTLPTNAVSFIKQNSLPRQIYSTFDWGAYMSWRLYPEYRMFTDSRYLDPSLYEADLEARKGKIQPLFDTHGINTVVHFPIYFNSRSMEPITLRLLGDKAWKLVFFNYKSMIFVRKGSAPHVPGINREYLIDYLLDNSIQKSIQTPDNPDVYLEMAYIYNAAGDSEKSRLAYMKAKSLMRKR